MLIPRVHERYGHDRSALVAAFPTYRARGAIRELGKALGLPPGEIERVARGSEGWDAREVGKDIEARSDRSRRPATAARVERAAGRGWRGWRRRRTGCRATCRQHSGGMIVATRPLIDCCPIVPAAMEGRQIVQWDKDSCSDAGFLKIDLLGLGMLSAVERAVEMIARTRGERIDLSRIPYDDPATYECIQNADTTGVFQIESRAQMQSLRRTRPENLQDLTIQVAIVRPGPIQGGAVNPYIERRQRLRVDPDYEVPYEHPSLEPVLRETLGTIIFQDQVLEVAIAFAGLLAGRGRGAAAGDEPQALGRGDRGPPRALRRGRAAPARGRRGDRRAGVRDGPGASPASASRRPTAPPSGCSPTSRPGCASTTAPEFLCSLLNEQPMGFYPPDALVHEAQRRGIEVLRAGRQRERGRVRDEAERAARVRIGLGYVRGVREQEVEALVAAREAGGRFRSLSDLASRAGAGAASLELLAWSGACDSLVPAGAWRPPDSARRIALWQLGVATPGPRRSGRHPAGAAARPAGAARAARALGVGVDARRLRHDRADRPRASDGAAARPAAGRRGHEPGPRDARATAPG